jgi:hypothetical protein
VSHPTRSTLIKPSSAGDILPNVPPTIHPTRIPPTNHFIGIILPNAYPTIHPTRIQSTTPVTCIILPNEYPTIHHTRIP